MIDLQQAAVTAVEIARSAGSLLMTYFGKPQSESTKATFSDIVTAADKASEAHIAAALTAAFPDHHVVGEEGGGYGAGLAEADYRWYVDPLDGTINFASSIPIFAVSLALTDAIQRPLVGVVFNPAYDRLFCAVRGAGVTLNGQPVRVSARTALAQSLLASGFATIKAQTDDNNLREWGAFLPQVRDLRRFGSAALDLCFVAMGRLDGYWEPHLNPWDCLAGILCVQEAGGRVTDYEGSDAPQTLAKGRVVASNGHIHAEMLRVLAAARR